MLAEMLVDLEAELARRNDRHDQLTRRYERLERQTDDLTNPETVRGRKLLADYERLSELHARSDEEIDELENQVLEPLRDIQEVLRKLVA
ncbi:hypothetical protein BOO71_0000265 [Deinococcus marmoris]|uniref:Uncharacterized protein n=2 Tax=Deinococcus marmoris TaxID=249408 RepID=A0A1U7P521_9DEIO|nr:hypothetical protein BOO71_0000265 [Deinococcus marmoris]